MYKQRNKFMEIKWFFRFAPLHNSLSSHDCQCHEISKLKPRKINTTQSQRQPSFNAADSSLDNLSVIASGTSQELPHLKGRMSSSGTFLRISGIDRMAGRIRWPLGDKFINLVQSSENVENFRLEVLSALAKKEQKQDTKIERKRRTGPALMALGATQMGNFWWIESQKCDLRCLPERSIWGRAWVSRNRIMWWHSR